MSTCRDNSSPPPSRFNALRGLPPGREDNTYKRSNRFQERSVSPSSKRRRSSASHPPPQKPLPSQLPEPQASSRNGDELFQWKKKAEQQRKSGGPSTHESEAVRIKTLRDELLEAQRQRARRDDERSQWEAEASRDARRTEQDRNVDARRADAAFAGQQHFARQAIRLRQGRPVGADGFSRIVRLDIPLIDDAATDAAAIPHDDVAQLVRGVAYDDLSDVLEAVESELDFIPDFSTDNDNVTFSRATRLQFWQCVRTVLSDRLHTGKDGAIEHGVHPAVRSDLNALLEGLSPDKLCQLDSHISMQLEPIKDGDRDKAFGEVDFWTSTLKRIRSLLAEDKLRQIVGSLRSERSRRAKSFSGKGDGTGTRNAGGHGDNDAEQKETDMVRAEAAKGMDENEELFAEEVELNKNDDRGVRGDSNRQTMGWHGWNDKYRPRKPKYFNRVHTGYTWSAYNRTHYDHDNPPPKTVQGYKFNIFYPDLMDPSRTPSYSISKTDNPDVATITFKAGPPYEDVAFKIVNRPWEKSHKRGFRCSYDRGVLQLWFYFQRYRYRR